MLNNSSIYIVNLAKYNEGNLVGNWIKLPMDEIELQNKLKNILGHDEEYVIHDYELPFHISEYENVFELNQNIEKLSNFDDEIIKAVNEFTDEDLERTIELLKNNDFYYVNDVCDEIELGEKVDTELLPFDYQSVYDSNAHYFINWEQVGNAMLMNENWFISSNNIAIKCDS